MSVSKPRITNITKLSYFGLSCQHMSSHVLRMFGGRASDKHITAESTDLLDYCKTVGGKILWQRLCRHIENDKPGHWHYAVKCGDCAQFIASEVEQLTDISSCCLHVEHIQQIKSFNISMASWGRHKSMLLSKFFSLCIFDKLSMFHTQVIRMLGTYRLKDRHVMLQTTMSFTI